LGVTKKNILNGLLGTGTVTQRQNNPAWYTLNNQGSVRTFRFDRLNYADPYGTGYFPHYNKININALPDDAGRMSMDSYRQFDADRKVAWMNKEAAKRGYSNATNWQGADPQGFQTADAQYRQEFPTESMPQQIPREAQGMPDAPTFGRGDGMVDRKSLQQRAKDLGLPATGTTKEIARMVSIGEKSPYEWTREEFNEIAPHLSIHQDMRPGSDARAPQIMERGLQSGMVDSVGAWGRNHTWAGGKMAGDNAYLFVSSKLKYRPGNLNPWLDEGNIPIARIKTKPGQTDIYEALIASRPQATPSAAPRAQAMPDSLESVPTDQLQRQYEENQGYLGLSTLGMREGRPVRGGAAQTRELLRRNEAISAELERRGVRSEDPQLQRALQRRGQAMPDVVAAGDQGVSMPKGTVTQLTNAARGALPRLPRGASNVPKLVVQVQRRGKPKVVKTIAGEKLVPSEMQKPKDIVVDGGSSKNWDGYTGEYRMPLPNIKLDKAKGVSWSKQDIYDVAQTDRAQAQANAQQSVQAAAMAAADPLKFVDPVGYSEIMRAAGVAGDILIPPSGLKLMLTDPAAFVGLLDGGFHGNRTVQGTRAAAMQGLDGVTEMRQLVNGRPSPFNTTLHHLWGTLSKQLDVINQEAAWMRLILDPKIIEAIDLSISGKFSMLPEDWKLLVAEALDNTKGDYRGQGNNAKSNANSFYNALVYHNGRWDEVAALYANNNAIDMRAQFNALGHGKVGMKNKVQGFVGLSFGVKGSVLDRWRFVDLYLPDVMTLTGAATPEQYFKYVGAQKVIPQDPIGIYKNYGTLENGNPAFSLALYNSLDSVAQVAINNSPELRNYLGAHADPGGLHWVTWNSIKNEAVGHSSLDITKNFVRKYGRNGTASDFAQFMRTAEGFVEGSNDAGQTIRLSLKNGAFNYLEQ
jgi:hypothetical protein